jgi:diaminopimelate epimerase
MDLSFYKLRLCDSDLVLVDDLDGNGRDRDWEEVARAILHRKLGAGADRMAVVARAERDYWLRVFRREGEGGPAADAALCAARYLMDSGRTGAESVRLRSSGGEIAVDVLDSASLGLSLGPPRALPGGEELDAAAAAARATVIESEGRRYLALPLRAGIPGADAVAVFADGGTAAARARISPGSGSGKAGRGEAPPVVSVRVVSRGEMKATFPSGGGLDACAAAAAAVAAAASVGYADREAMVCLRSGELWAEWTARGSVYVAGRPEYVYRGEYHVGERSLA